MAYISEQELEAVRAKADIVDIVGHYLPIEKRGNTYRAVCPFHNDHDPSLNLNPERQIYKCFVCGAGGNVFGFVQNYEKISFPEAVGKVADMVGFTLSVNPSVSPRQVDPKKQELYDVLNDTIRYTMYELNGVEAKREKEYLLRRQMDEEILKKFEIGFNPAGDALSHFLHAKGYEDRTIVRTNVARMSANGLHDVFASRITFPIHDAFGNPVGFSARTLDPDNPSKYINTTETELYVKGRIVYNAHRARDAARKASKLYICEGVTDVIAFARAGIDNAVCTLGTACTVEQIAVMKRLSVHLVFCYDGDRAGQNATVKAVRLARSQGCSVSVIENTTGKDPDEIIRQEGKEALLSLLSKEISWMEFYIKFESARVNMDSYLEKKEFVEKVLKEIDTLQDAVDREYFTNLISQMTQIPLSVKKKAPTEHYAQNQVKPVRTAVPSGIDKAEEQILISMLKYPAASIVFEENLGYLINENRQHLAVLIMDMVHSEGKVNPQTLLDRTEDQNIKNIITELISSEFYDVEYDSDMLLGAIGKVKRTYLEKEAEQYRSQLAGPLNEESRKKIMQAYTECISKLADYMDEEEDS